MTNGRTTVVRCGIVLSGGDGKRLEPFVRRLRGDALPKQYVDFTGDGSLLEQTFRRAARLLPMRQVFTIVTRRHYAYPEVWRQLADRPGGRIVVQPENKDTAPGLLLPLVRIMREYGDATVVVMPSDHGIDDDAGFAMAVENAFDVVEADPARIVLLGVSPDVPEPDYGYVLAGEFAIKGARPVTRFVEKPGPKRAEDLMARGALWNTFIMVFRASTLWAYIQKSAPSLAGAFQRLFIPQSPSAERAAIEHAYQRIHPLNFSTAFLRDLPGATRPILTVMDMDGVGWTDRGIEARLPASMRSIGSEIDGDPVALCA